MYLYATVYMSKYDRDKGKKASKIRALFPDIYLSDNLDSVSVKFEIGYWRKANHIHKWFVENVQEGEDNCQNSYVSREDLKKLLSLVEEALNNKKKSKTLLPTESGFFFGGTKYDKYYFNDLKSTKEIIVKALKLPDEYEFEYHSSW